MRVETQETTKVGYEFSATIEPTRNHKNRRKTNKIFSTNGKAINAWFLYQFDSNWIMNTWERRKSRTFQFLGRFHSFNCTLKNPVDLQYSSFLSHSLLRLFQLPPPCSTFFPFYLLIDTSIIERTKDILDRPFFCVLM